MTVRRHDPRQRRSPAAKLLARLDTHRAEVLRLLDDCHVQSPEQLRKLIEGLTQGSGVLSICPAGEVGPGGMGW